jgi:hypothetical protein
MPARRCVAHCPDISGLPSGIRGTGPFMSGNGTPYLYHPSAVVSWGCSGASPDSDTSSKAVKDLRLLNPSLLLTAL